MSDTASKLPLLTARSLSFVGWLTASWLLMIALGASALRTDGSLGARNPVSFERSVFASVNGATQSGFVMTFARPQEFSTIVQGIFGLQTLMGTLLGLAGGGVLLSRLLGLRHSDGRVALWALILIAFAGVVGVATIGSGEPLGYAIHRGIAALGCSGLNFGPLPTPGQPSTLIALLPLSVIGSLGVVATLELLDWVRYGIPIHPHVRSAAGLAGGVYIVGTLIAWLLSADPVRASSIVLSARAYGLPIEFAATWPRGLAWWVIGIALVGAGTAGSAGGVGIGYLATFHNRHLPAVLAGVGVQLALLFGAVVILMQTEPQMLADRVVLLVVSAAMGLGLSHDPISLTGPGLYVLAGLMLASRLLPLIVLAAMLRNGLGSRGGLTQVIVDK